MLTWFLLRMKNNIYIFPLVTGASDGSIPSQGVSCNNFVGDDNQMFILEKKKNIFLEDIFPFLMLVFMVIFFVVTLFMCSGMKVYATETSSESDYTQTDLEQDERLNSLEIRLEEMGYSIDEVNRVIISLQEADTLLEEQNLLISEKLDLCIIALNDLVNYSIEHLKNDDAAELLTEEYRTAVISGITTNETAMSTLNENTVSGNTIISTFNDSVSENLQLTSENTLQELNKTLLVTNTFLSYLFILLLIVLVLFICYGIGALIHKLIFSHVR